MVLALCIVAAAGAACKKGPDDAAITATVKSKLAADTTTPAIGVNVTTKDGVVTLTGTVDNDAAKAKAESIAKGTEGVKSVTNNLTVKPAVATTPPAMPSANDTAIMNAISANLTKAGITGVTVDVADGVATLKGSVAKADMTKAVQAANEANPKPTRVMNQLTAK
jgi:osmotically-inducible protein OsmY